MVLTHRSCQILKQIVDSKRSLRIRELAEKFQVSVRAIKYDLETIRTWLHTEEHSAVRLESKPNRGIWLEGDKAAINQLLYHIQAKKEQAVILSQGERVKCITMELLTAQDYITIGGLEEKIGVSRNTVVSDLQEVQQSLLDWNIVLERKTYKGLRIKASEMERRLALEYILQSLFTSKDMSRLLQSLVQNEEISPRIRQVAGQFALTEQEIRQIYQTTAGIVQQACQSGGNLSERVVLGLFIRLCVVIRRIRDKHTLMGITVPELIAEQQEYYRNFCDRCSDLAKNLQMPIAESEIYYVWLQWLGVFGSSPVGGGYHDLDITVITRSLVDGVGRLAKVPFHEDEELFDNLLAHLNDRLAKYRRHASDPNPLLAEVMQIYGNLFQYVKQVSFSILKDFNIYLNDADIAYLVLHFQAAYERKFSEYQYKTLVVCGTGRGSARLLKIRLENEIKNLQVVGCCSILEIDKVLERYPIDLVISVLPLKEDYPTVVIGAIPTRQDFAVVEAALKEIHPKDRRQLPSSPLLANNSFLTSLSMLKIGFSSENLPEIENLSREIINQGFQMATLITTEFKDYLTEQAAAGLTIHILLMVNRLVFDSPYTDIGANYNDSEHIAMLRAKLTALLKRHYSGIPPDEIDVILRYLS